LLELQQVRLRDLLFQVFFLLSHWISPWVIAASDLWYVGC
jgi:hypothetical protein